MSAGQGGEQAAVAFGVDRASAEGGVGLGVQGAWRGRRGEDWREVTVGALPLLFLPPTQPHSLVAGSSGAACGEGTGPAGRAGQGSWPSPGARAFFPQ